MTNEELDLDKILEGLGVFDLDESLREIRDNHDETYDDINRNANPAYLLLIDITNQRVSVYNRKTKRIELSTACSTGTGIPTNGYNGQTHSGLFEILLKEETSDEPCEFDPSRRPYGTHRFSYHNQLLFANRAAGAIHGTDEEHKLGSKASAGCVRVSNKDIVTLNERYVGVGTPVLVCGD